MGLQIKRVVCNQVSVMCIMCYVCLLQMADESRKKLYIIVVSKLRRNSFLINIKFNKKELAPERIPNEKAEEYRNYMKVTLGKFF